MAPRDPKDLIDLALNGSSEEVIRVTRAMIKDDTKIGGAIVIIKELRRLQRYPEGVQLAEELFNRKKRPRDLNFRFGPGTAIVYIRAAPNTTSFRAEPCTSPPPVGARARPSVHRR